MDIFVFYLLILHISLKFLQILKSYFYQIILKTIIKKLEAVSLTQLPLKLNK